MSSARPARLGGTNGYARPSFDEELNRLTAPVTSVVPGPPDVADNRGNSDNQGSSDNSDRPVGGRGTSTASRRDHVKVDRSLVDEMRDAVWFLSEHGRPRVQLGELFDEAARDWLETAKNQHNEGQPFPVRGRLR